MVELSIIKLLLDKKNYILYNNLIYNIKTEQEIYKILISISKYYTKHQHHVYISFDELENNFYLLYPSEKNNTQYQKIFERLRLLEVSDSLSAEIVRQFAAKEVAGRMTEILIPVLNGEDYNLLSNIPEIYTEWKEKALLLEEDASPYVDDDIEQIVHDTNPVSGLRWRLECLQSNFGSLPRRTLGHVFARVETGKTTFISSEITSLCKQLCDDEVALWVCNEEDGRKVKFRTYQSALNMSTADIRNAIDAGKAEEIKEKYRAETGDRIKILYDPNVTVEQIKSEMEKRNVRLLVVDIGDHVRFHGDSELATYSRLGELYRRFRSMAVCYDCDIITVGQANREIAGRRELHLEHMHNSSTDKPGALDYAIGIGATYNESEKELRWINIVKNKTGTPTMAEVNPVRIDTLCGRFYDI